jgi:amidase
MFREMMTIAVLGLVMSSCQSTGVSKEVMIVLEEEKSMVEQEIIDAIDELRMTEGSEEWDADIDRIYQLDASALAQEISESSLTSRQILYAYLLRIQQYNPVHNALITFNLRAAVDRAVRADEAHARGESWGPLHGVPFSVKDTFSTAEIRTTAGYPDLAQYVPDQDAVIVSRLLDAGAILIGKTNTPTLAMDMQTDNPLFGRTGNAIDASRTAGGSSGGASVAVALGMSAFDFGSDLAGSIRLPAAFNGVYGFRPTYGLISMRGHIPPVPGTTSGIRNLAVVGPIARSVRDLELLFELGAGPGDGDHRVAPLVHRDLMPEATLRIAWAEQFGGVPVSAEIRQAIEQFAGRLQAAGLFVERAEPEDFPWMLAWETWGSIVGAQGGYNRSNFARSIGSFFARSSVEESPMQHQIVGPISIPKYMADLERQDRCIEALELFLQSYDVWIVPVSSTVAFEHLLPSRSFGDYSVYNDPVFVDGQPVHYYVATQSYTTPFSLTESPVVTMPIGQDAQGMPIGVQIIGRRWDDARLLEIAEILDAINSESDR